MGDLDNGVVGKASLEHQLLAQASTVHITNRSVYDGPQQNISSLRDIHCLWHGSHIKNIVSLFLFMH